MEFKVIALKDAGIDIIDGDRGKNYPKKTEMTNQGHTLFLNNKNIINDYLDVTTGEFITENKSNELRKGKLIRDDIVMSTRGSVGNIGHYSENIALNNIRINSGMVILRNKNTQINTNYLYILLKSSYMKNQYLELISGSVQNQLPIRDLQHIKLRIPELIYQKKIVQVINNLEQKIFLNKKIISNFEQLSQTLFKHWFIDFEFPNEEGKPYKSSGGEMVESELEKIPLTWKIVKIDDIAIQKKAKINLDTSLEEFNYIGLEHMPQGNIGLNNWESSNKVSGNKSLFENGDILFGKLRPYFKKVGIAPVPGICSTDILVINSKIDYYKSYLFLQLIQDSFIKYTSNTATGTRMPRTSWKLISNYEIILPNKEVIIKFDEIISPILEKVNHLIHENNNLQQLRDTLLPKLLSGEIEIPDELEV